MITTGLQTVATFRQHFLRLN